MSGTYLKEIAVFAAKAYAGMFLVVLILSLILGFNLNVSLGYGLFYSLAGIVMLNIIAIDVIGSGIYITALSLYQVLVTVLAFSFTILWFKRRKKKYEYASVVCWSLGVVLVPIVMGGISSI